MFTIKIVKLPGAVKEYMSEDSVTAIEAIDEVGFSLDSNEKLTFNGSDISEDSQISTGGELIIKKALKGAFIA